MREPNIFEMMEFIRSSNDITKATLNANLFVTRYIGADDREFITLRSSGFDATSYNEKEYHNCFSKIDDILKEPSFNESIENYDLDFYYSIWKLNAFFANSQYKIKIDDLFFNAFCHLDNLVLVDQHRDYWENEIGTYEHAHFSLEEIETLSKLTRLTIVNCCLRDEHTKYLGLLNKLTHLNIADNIIMYDYSELIGDIIDGYVEVNEVCYGIEDLSFLTELKNLECLNISGNILIKNIKPLFKLKKLRLLICNDLKINPDDLVLLKDELVNCKIFFNKT